MSDAEVCKSALLMSKGYIGGAWTDAQSKKTFSVCNPSTGGEIAQVAAMGNNEVHDAIQAAFRAFCRWKQMSPRVRSEYLKAWHQEIMENIDELALITTAESGKPLNEARSEVAYAAGFLDFYAHECLHSAGFVVPASTQNQRIMAVDEPVGVCAIITPWNFPLAMITRKLGPCLAAGCTAVVRPASETPLSALALGKLAEKAGLPPGVLNIISSPHGTAKEVGTALASNEIIRKLSFTGSTSVGRSLMEQSAVNIKRISLELGGNAPFIVFEDADIDAAVAGLLFSKFRNAGQTCVCSNRVFVHESIFETFLKCFEKRVRALQMGSPFSESTHIGPLINQRTFDKVQAIVQDALDKGATAVVGGKPATKRGKTFFEPTILVDVNEHMRVWTDEIFGPVAPLFSFDTESEVIKKANSTISGLAAYFYTRNLSRAMRVANALESGMVGVNTAHISSPQAPFGGVKQSGVGREGSFLGLHEYTETKLISMTFDG